MNKQQKRLERLVYTSGPRYIRCYDSGPNSGADRYTVVYTGRQGGDYVGMSAEPTHPQGICIHGDGLVDRTTRIGKFAYFHWPPPIGKKGKLGLRIPYADLPSKCREVVLSEYAEAWGLDLKDVKNICERTF